MPSAIKTITNQHDIEKVLNGFFVNNDVYVKTKNGNLGVQFVGVNSNEVAIKLPYIKNIAENVLIFSRRNGNTVYVNLKLVEKQGENDFVFTPIKMQIIYAERSEARVNVSGSDEKKILFISNIISDFMVENDLERAVKTVDRIKTMIISKIGKYTERIKIFFINEGGSDTRLKHFIENKNPYIIESFNEEERNTDKSFFGYYKTNIYNSDYYLINRKNLISEAAVPILLRDSMTIGYILANNSRALNDNFKNILVKLAKEANSMFLKNRIIAPQMEKLLVTDISTSGLSIAFKERKYIRLFKEKSLAMFNLIIPGNIIIEMLVEIKNITLLENKIFKVGCMIKKIPDYSKGIYNEFLGSNDNDSGK